MFDEFEEKILTYGYFVVLDWQKDQVKLKSTETKQYWIMKKFNKEGYPGLVLYHSHDGGQYHVHFCYKDQSAAPAVTIIKKLSLIQDSLYTSHSHSLFFCR